MRNYFIAVMEKKNGSNKGAIFVGDSRIPDLLIYNPDSEVDYTKEGEKEVEMSVSTKSFTFNTGFVRLMELLVNYQKTDDKNVITKIENIDAGENSWTDNINSIRDNGAKTSRIRIDRMVGVEKYFNKAKLIILGSGLKRLSEIKLIGRIVDRGRRS